MRKWEHHFTFSMRHLYISKWQSYLDTKWKLIDPALENSTDKFGVSRDDMFQLYAYGSKYLGGRGDLFLIYPTHTDFQSPIQDPLLLDEQGQMRLWVIPFPLTGLGKNLWDDAMLEV